jgi:hypothetical protein
LRAGPAAHRRCNRGPGCTAAGQRDGRAGLACRIPASRARWNGSEARRFLIDGHWFVAEDVGVPDLRPDEWDDEIDHDWHELHSFSGTGAVADDARSRDIADFLQELRAKLPASLPSSPAVSACADAQAGPRMRVLRSGSIVAYRTFARESACRISSGDADRAGSSRFDQFFPVHSRPSRHAGHRLADPPAGPCVPLPAPGRGAPG